MTFAVKNLSVLAYAQGFTLWHYRADGALSAVEAPGYFDAARELIAARDMLMICADDGAAVMVAAPCDSGVRMVALR